MQGKEYSVPIIDQSPVQPCRIISCEPYIWHKSSTTYTDTVRTRFACSTTYTACKQAMASAFSSQYFLLLSLVLLAPHLGSSTSRSTIPSGKGKLLSMSLLNHRLTYSYLCRRDGGGIAMPLPGANPSGKLPCVDTYEIILFCLYVFLSIHWTGWYILCRGWRRVRKAAAWSESFHSYGCTSTTIFFFERKAKDLPWFIK